MRIEPGSAECDYNSNPNQMIDSLSGISSLGSRCKYYRRIYGTSPLRREVRSHLYFDSDSSELKLIRF